MNDKEINETKIVRTYCHSCKNETNQIISCKDIDLSVGEIIARNEKGDESESMWGIIVEVWELTKCQGCSRLNLKITKKKWF